MKRGAGGGYRVGSVREVVNLHFTKGSTKRKRGKAELMFFRALRRCLPIFLQFPPFLLLLLSAKKVLRLILWCSLVDIEFMLS